MKRLLLLGTAMSLAMIAGASAADLRPVPVYTKASPPMSWTGCYLGANVGGGWSTTSAVDATFGTSDGSVNGAGVVGGVQGGCDYQAGLFVFGFQGIFDGTSIQGSGSYPTGVINNSGFLPWLGTATGRIGYTVMPTTLIYAKGGAAWVRDNFTGITAATTVPFSSASYTANGWTVGGGIEHMFAPHWSVFVEYDYIGLNNTTANFSLLPLPPNGGATFPVNVSQNVQMAIVGVNFKFWY